MSAPIFSDDEAAALLRQQGVPEHLIAKKFARREDAIDARLAERRANVLEKAEQNVIRKMALAVGMVVRSTSQPRASKVAPGLPDLILSHRARKFFGFWEAKRQVGGILSTAQEEFAADCANAGVAWGCGDRYHFAHWLDSHGFTSPSIPMD